ncbi:MAG: N-6 DNA methylase [Bacteroidetes bacterium]|nr:N-6 DNA methylase [Bacteroidota bacterium]
MANVGAVVNGIRNIMRQDRGISGDAQRLEQLGWMLFLKIMDDKDQELEVIKDNYVSVIPEKFRWRNWATNPEGITGDELLNFIDNNSEKENEKGLFSALRSLTKKNTNKRAVLVQEVFEGNNNYMKSGYELRKVINKLNEIDFTKSEDKHVFGNIYETILQELRDAGNKGEYYTPRAVTQLMTMLTNPKLGDKVLDPAAGTGGFLTAAIDHVREHFVKTVDDEAILQNSITGWELKPVAYVLGLTNLILHEMDLPDYHYIDSLKKEYNSIGKKDKVDVILANPPFGASIADGVETNFPANYRCKESADLFIVLMIQLLKDNGKCAIVLPDGSITGEGIKARIREKLLTECNLHTIIRLPQSTFFPATVSTNLLFFEKGSPTKEIWYYEHKLPEGQKSYSKLKPIRFEEFNPIIEWWNNRVESEFAYKVNIDDLKEWDLNVTNPNKKEDEKKSPKQLYSLFENSQSNINKEIKDLTNEILEKPTGILQLIVNQNIDLFKTKESVSVLRDAILLEAITGNLTNNWRENNKTKETVIDLLKKVKLEKDKKIKDKLIKPDKEKRTIDKSTIPYKIPNEWQFAYFNDISNFQIGKTPATKQMEYWSQGEFNWLSIGDMEHYGYILHTSKKITKDAVKEVFNGQLPSPAETLLMSFKLTIGKMSITKIATYHNEAIISIYPYTQIERDYLFYLLPIVTKLSISKKVLMGQTFNSKSLTDLIVPIPPHEEQLEIIKRVKHLMDKCKNIEGKLIEHNALSMQLIQSAIEDHFVKN